MLDGAITGSLNRTAAEDLRDNLECAVAGLVEMKIAQAANASDELGELLETQESIVGDLFTQLTRAVAARLAARL